MPKDLPKDLPKNPPKKVLAIGIDPAFVDYAMLPQFSPDVFRSYIDTQLECVRAAGFEVTSCLIDLGETAETVTMKALGSDRFDCVLIGAGLRQGGSDRLLLFEKILTIVHAQAPNAHICFNTTPADSSQAVQHWIKP